jgi:hypothetical protein
MSSSVDIFILIIKEKLPRGWNELKIDNSLINDSWAKTATKISSIGEL